MAASGAVIAATPGIVQNALHVRSERHENISMTRM
ncbi:hypothetical protein SCE1572_16125 [Sorangium cellulosum So0157-2]|uniref:Uncharacterized protein n=1 Tax=Sorangium cellulosum So0157-2 TaxID=1254432 RepID=S4XTN8_SORCE|nr:hypothetical protein SCE1572_16125 [Sorangium cellulosum So0157-2]